MGTSKVLRLILLLLVVVGAVACDGSEAPGTDPSEETERDEGADEQAIEEAFEAYKAALLGREGERAAGLVTRATIDYYDEMRTLALEADRAELENRRILDRFTVLMLRHVMTAKQLKPMTGEDVFAFAVDEGLIGESTVVGMEPEDVTVSGDVGTLNVALSGENASFEYLYRYEDAGWRLDLFEFVETYEAAFQTQADQSGGDRAFLFQLLTSVSGRRPTPDIWQPLDS